MDSRCSALSPGLDGSGSGGAHSHSHARARPQRYELGVRLTVVNINTAREGERCGVAHHNDWRYRLSTANARLELGQYWCCCRC